MRILEPLKNQFESWRSSGKSWKFVSEKGYKPCDIIILVVSGFSMLQ